MNYKFSKHLQDQLKLREISIDLIESVLENPEQKVPGKKGETVYQSQIMIGGESYLIRVPVNENVNPAVVITAYFTSKIKKYWKE